MDVNYRVPRTRATPRHYDVLVVNTVKRVLHNRHLVRYKRAVPTHKEPIFQCPRCLRVAGRPDRPPISERELVRLLIRCSSCQHRWAVVLPASEVAAAKK